MTGPSFGLVLVAAFVVATGLAGFYNGARQLSEAPNALATLTHILNLLMGIAGVPAAVMIWRQDPRAIIPMVIWAASAVGAAMLAPRAYEPSISWPTAIGSGVAAAAVVVAVVAYASWRLRLTARGESSPAS